MGELADIEPGFQFRKGIIHAPTGEARALQLKDVAADGTIWWSTLERVIGDGVSAKYFVRKNDVLIAARGTRNQAFAINEAVTDVIAPSHFFILRPKAENLSADYLVWFLQLPATRALLGKERWGTTVQMLPRASLGEIAIPLPPIEIQKKVAALAKLITEEAVLVNELQSKRELLLQNLLTNRVKELSLKGE